MIQIYNTSKYYTLSPSASIYQYNSFLDSNGYFVTIYDSESTHLLCTRYKLAPVTDIMLLKIWSLLSTMKIPPLCSWASLVVKNPPANAGDLCSSLGWGDSPGERNGNPLQYSCLGNPTDRGAWWAIGHWVAKGRTRLRLHACTLDFY